MVNNPEMRLERWLKEQEQGASASLKTVTSATTKAGFIVWAPTPVHSAEDAALTGLDPPYIASLGNSGFLAGARSSAG